MEDLRLNAVAARVVAWHNRHPLARRITAAQVHSIGYVALPYSVAGAGVDPEFDAPAAASAPAEGGSLRERALARSRHQGDAALPVLDTTVALPGAPKPGALKAAFAEDFIAPLSPRAVARWARRHGRARAQAPADAPLREVLALPLPAGRKPITLFVLTAAIEVGGARRRVLLGAGEKAPVMGRFLWSVPRSAGLALGVLVTALALRLGLPMAAPGAPAMAAVPAAQTAQAASAAAAPEAAASHPQVEVAMSLPAEPAAPAEATHTPPHEGPQLHVAALAPAASAAAAAEPHPSEPVLSTPPLDVEPTLGRITLPPLDLPRKDAAKTASRLAREQRAEALAAAASAPAAASSAPAASPVVAAATTTTPAAAAPPAVPRGAPAFAVSTRLLRTRAEADQMAAAMGVLLQGKDGSALRVDVLAQGEDWRVVGWPFAAAAQADKARALLAARGMRVAVVDF